MTQWKLVPVEPTPEMIKAGAYELYTPCEEGWEPPASDVHCAMLAAAPAPDVQPAIYPEEAREMGLEEVPYYTHPPVEDVRPVAYETENELWWHDAPDINDYIRSTGIPLYRHPPTADVQELVQALKEIIEHCPNSWAEIRADVALKKWEGK